MEGKKIGICTRAVIIFLFEARSESLEIKLEVINDERCSSKKMSEKVDRIEAVNKKDIGVQCNPPLVLRLAVDPLSKTFNIVK